MRSRSWPRRGVQPSSAALSGLGWVAILTIALAGLVAACQPTGEVTPSPSPTPLGSGGPAPAATRWPLTTVESTVALGAAHNDMIKMFNDVSSAVAAEDPARIATAMDDSLAFLTGNQTNIPRLQAYDSTKPVGDRLAVVYDKMIQGATLVRDGIRGGDGAAVESGFQIFFEGNTEYLAVAPDLVDLSEQAVLMQDILVR